MIEFEELNQRLMQSEEPISNLKEALDIDNVKIQIEELEKQSAAPDFWDDMENSQKVMQKIERMYNKYSPLCKISFMLDTSGLTGYKCSPTDCGKDIFMRLWKERILA